MFYYVFRLEPYFKEEQIGLDLLFITTGYQSIMIYIAHTQVH